MTHKFAYLFLHFGVCVTRESRPRRTREQHLFQQTRDTTRCVNQQIKDNNESRQSIAGFSRPLSSSLLVLPHARHTPHTINFGKCVDPANRTCTK